MDATATARQILVSLLKGDLSLGSWLGIDTGDLQRLVELGNGKLAMGRPEEARRIFEGLTALEPGVASFHTALGMAWDAEGANDAALEAFTTAIHMLAEKEDLGLCAAYLGRGSVRIRLGDTAGALTDLELARQHDRGVDPTLSQNLQVMVERCAEQFASEME